MRMTRDDLERTGAKHPLELFLQGIRAEETREKYLRTLRQVLCKILADILEGSFEQRVEQFVRLGKEDPDWMRDLLLSMSKKLRERTELPRNHPDYYNPVSFGSYFKAIKKLLDMNDVTVAWKRIYATFPEIDNVADSRGWDREEIRKMLRFASGPMDRAIVLLAASSGIRAGGFMLKWGDIKPVYKKGGELGFDAGDGAELACAMVTVYAGTAASYPAFVTPEAYGALEDYRAQWTADVGRGPGPGDPLFKKNGMLPAQTGLSSIKKRVERMITRAGLRDPSRKVNRRFDVPMINGFRRHWNKACKESRSRDSPLSSLIKKEYMMGHAGLVSLDRNYFKVHVLELAEEYLQAVPLLTIDDAARLRESDRRKSERIRDLEAQAAEIAALREMVSELAARSGS